MADQNKVEKQVEAALGKMQKELEQEAQKHMAETAKLEKLAAAMKKLPKPPDEP